jgi:hypothetical protein
MNIDDRPAPNAEPELLLEEGATEERTLEAVSSRPWLAIRLTDLGLASLLPLP